ncbi:unnamed protein product [Durusdinium trenchii]|uniref:J domain-containing protein n=1 Tax=Durusdinium trenchii TaxID=1381693 RepID=A0ABP0SWV0_9DINO
MWHFKGMSTAARGSIGIRSIKLFTTVLLGLLHPFDSEMKKMNFRSVDMVMTYYGELGISQSASHREVLLAHRERALQTHPDKGGSHDAFVKVQQAFEVLSDAWQRAEYDAMLRLLAKGPGKMHRARTPKPPKLPTPKQRKQQAKAEKKKEKFAARGKQQPDFEAEKAAAAAARADDRKAQEAALAEISKSAKVSTSSTQNMMAESKNAEAKMLEERTQAMACEAALREGLAAQTSEHKALVEKTQEHEKAVAKRFEELQTASEADKASAAAARAEDQNAHEGLPVLLACKNIAYTLQDDKVAKKFFNKSEFADWWVEHQPHRRQCQRESSPE